MVGLRPRFLKGQNMSLHTTYEFDHIWNKLQEPVRPSAKPADYLLLLSAIDEGWKILEATHYITPNSQRGGQYLITLFHTTKPLTQSILVNHNPDLAAVLGSNVTVVNRQLSNMVS